MIKVIYMEETIALMGNGGQLEFVQELIKVGEVKELQNGYRYVVTEN